MNFNENPRTGGKFLKIEPEKSVAGVFRGEPKTFYVKKTGNNEYKECPASEPGSTFRFKINFIMRESDLTYKAYVWEQSATVYNLLKEFNQSFPLESTIVKISRSGSGLNTKYTILPNGHKAQVTPEMDDLLKHTSLHDLSNDKKDDVSEEAHNFPAEVVDNNEEVPF